MEEKKLGIVCIVVEDLEQSAVLNTVLHENAGVIIGRMGIPRPDRGVSLISVAVEATANQMNTLAGSLGRIPGIKVKSVQAGK
jgi:putative iron-only hydrogenase system regulator